MTSTNIEAVIGRISETLVLCDATDLQDLAQIHTGLLEIVEWAKENQHPRCQKACEVAGELVENIILSEDKTPDVSLGELGKMIALLQRIAEGVSPEDDADFSPRFCGVPVPAAANETANTLAASIPTVVAGSYKIELPAHVDESIFSEFLSRQDSVLEEMESLILVLENEQVEQTLNELKRYVHTLKGESALLGLNDVERLCHVAEDDLTGDRPIITDNLFAMKDWLKRAFDAYSGKGEPPEDPGAIIACMKRGEAFSAKIDMRDEVAPPPPPAAPAESGKKPGELVFEPTPLDGDQELLSDFILEAVEHLENSDLHLLTLETDCTNEDAVNAVFRAFHTIKGVAGFLHLNQVQAIAHDTENLLDRARKGTMSLSGIALDLVFDAVDLLKKCVENVRIALGSGDLLMPAEGVAETVLKIRGVLDGSLPVSQPKASAQPIARLGEVLVETGVASTVAVEQALRAQHLIPDPKRLGDVLTENNITSSKRVGEALSLQKEFPDQKLGEILVDMGAVSDKDLERSLDMQNNPAPSKLGEVLVRSGECNAREVVQALRVQKGTAGAPTTIQVREAVKVDADRLDLLVDMIGELVIAESMVAQSEDLRRNISTDLARHMSLLDKITRELQVTAMSLRMVPIRSTFQKMARLVRDLSKKTGKQVEFFTAGEETELDKTVVDKIGDPLVHIIRNAVDHGMEDGPDARRAAGKNATGEVWLRAFHAGGNIHIQVQDDGRGLNKEAILQKGIERGLIQEGVELSERDIFNLIFEPGFSTAKKITEVSGRGVGMDVVKRNIEALRGKVEIQSTPGHGSIFTIQLPLTLAIIDGMVVRVGHERYIIPTLSIVISLKPSVENLHTVVGKGEMLKLQGKLLPMFRLYDAFSVAEAITDPLEGTVVVVEHDGAQAGILVDEILGQQQIVIKSLGDSLKGLAGLSGSAIMPDGRVGLIVDVGGLVDSVTSVGA